MRESKKYDELGSALGVGSASRLSPAPQSCFRRGYPAPINGERICKLCLSEIEQRIKNEDEGPF